MQNKKYKSRYIVILFYNVVIFFHVKQKKIKRREVYWFYYDACTLYRFLLFGYVYVITFLDYRSTPVTLEVLNNRLQFL